MLATFAALARTGSFTSAATELHLAQSTVTAHIQALEKELRLRLVDRLPGGAVLTEAGKRVLDKATLVLAAEAELRGERAEHGPIEGTVRIGAPESLCGQLLPPVVAALRRRHPGVDVTLNPVGTAAAIDALRAGALSLALLIEPSIDAADLVVERLGTLDIAFVADRRTPVTATTWAELAHWHWFLLEEGCAYSDEVARLLPGARATRLGSIEATRACVAAGLGLAVLPGFAVDERRLARFAGPPLTEPDLLLVRHARRSAGRALPVVEEEVRRGAAKLIS